MTSKCHGGVDTCRWLGAGTALIGFGCAFCGLTIISQLNTYRTFRQPDISGSPPPQPPQINTLPVGRGEFSYLAPLGRENISAPYFKQCFFQGGVITTQTVKHHASQSQDRNNKYFILYIEFVAADLLFRLARMRHA